MPFNFLNLSLDNLLVLDQLIIPYLKVFLYSHHLLYIEIVGRNLSWPLMGVKG